MATIRAFGVQDRFMREIALRTDTNIRCILPRHVINRWLSLRLEIVGSAILLAVTLLIVIYRKNFETIPGLIGLLVTYSMYTTDNLNWMTRLSAEMQTEIVAVERIQEYTDNQQENEWERKQKRDPILQPEWPASGAIEFSNYSLRYRDGLDLVIKDLNVKIKPGELFLYCCFKVLTTFY